MAYGRQELQGMAVGDWGEQGEGGSPWVYGENEADVAMQQVGVKKKKKTGKV